MEIGQASAWPSFVFGFLFLLPLRVRMHRLLDLIGMVLFKLGLCQIKNYEPNEVSG